MMVLGSGNPSRSGPDPAVHHANNIVKAESVEIERDDAEAVVAVARTTSRGLGGQKALGQLINPG